MPHGQNWSKPILYVEVLYSKTGIINNSLIDSLDFIMSILSYHVKPIIVNDFPPHPPPPQLLRKCFVLNNR